MRTQIGLSEAYCARTNSDSKDYGWVYDGVPTSVVQDERHAWLFNIDKIPDPKRKEMIASYASSQRLTFEKAEHSLRITGPIYWADDVILTLLPDRDKAD